MSKHAPHTSIQNPVEGLKTAMLERARKLAEEHLSQGKLSRQKILQDAREKVHLMEQKELLLAKSLSERAYLRKIQASEIQMQAELDRNRWGLIQTVMEKVQHHLLQLQQDESAYHKVFLTQFKQAAALFEESALTAYINQQDHQRYAASWESLCSEVTSKTVSLSSNSISCSGGIKLTSNAGDIMLDNTFEGLLSRQQEQLQKIIFERLFATVDGTGGLLHG